jgi:hypothetical protein
MELLRAITLIRQTLRDSALDGVHTAPVMAINMAGSLGKLTASSRPFHRGTAGGQNASRTP